MASTAVSHKMIDESHLDEKLEQFKETINSSPVSVKNLKFAVDDLLEIADAPQLTVKFRVAACNILCGGIEQCISSKDPSVRLVVCQDSIPHRVTELYVGRYDHVKAKAMKQVLNTLIRLLRCADDLEIEPRPKVVALEQIFKILVIEGDHVKAKPALHALTFMTNKKLIAAPDIVLAFQRWRLIDNDLKELALPGSDSDNFKSFLRVVLGWIKYSDVAATAGQFLTTFLTQPDLPARTSPLNAEQNQAYTFKWVEPLLDSIREDPGALLAFRTYAFPGLFQLDVQGYWTFLLKLGIETYLKPSHNSSQLVEPLFKSEEIREEVLFSALQTGKECSLVKITVSTSRGSLSLTNKHVIIPDRHIGRLLAHSSSVARLAGLTLLVSSPQITIPLTKYSLKTLRRYIPHLFADANPHFRGEVQGLIQSLVDRLRAVTFNLYSSTNRPQNSKKEAVNISTKDDESGSTLQPNEYLEINKEFLRWFVEFLNAELHSCASYQRHISALKSLKILLRSGLDISVPPDILAKQARGDIGWAFHLSVLGMNSTRHLTDLLLDAFDDVRQGALSVLQIQYASASWYSGQVLGPGSNEPPPNLKTNFDHTISRGQNLMMQTSRVDHADGVARLYDLACFVSSQSRLRSSNDKIVCEPTGTYATYKVVERLVSATEEAIIIARNHLYTAVEKAPVHGLFTSLRYAVTYLAKTPSFDNLLKHRMELVERMLNCVSGIWECVQHLLCNDAPEGYMPEDAEGETDMTTKDIFSYSWRALKDSSLLLRQIVSSGLDGLLNIDGSAHTAYKSWGDLCFQQLAELRHRGAFSTVSQTFYLVCERCVKHQQISVNRLVPDWYQATKELIQQRGSTITRRSAGIPALMVSVLSADPKSGLFDTAIEDLQELAVLRTEDARSEDLPQVHALNSLKAIFTSTKLAARSERHVTSSIKVAAECLGSEVWAIRNCGLMLFRGLFDRLLGSDQKLVSSTRKATQVTPLRWSSYPGLLDLLIGLLQESQEKVLLRATKELESFSALHAEKIFPAIDMFRRARPPPERVEQVVGLVRQALSSPHWHIRVIASRTDAALAAYGKQNDDELVQSVIENTVHGHLLAWRHRIRDILQHEDISRLYTAQQRLNTLLGVLSSSYHCANTWAAFSDALVELGEFHFEQSASCSERVTLNNRHMDSSMGENARLDYLKMVESFEKAANPGSGSRASALLGRSARLVLVLSEIIGDTSAMLESTNAAARSQRIASMIADPDVDISLWLIERLETISEDIGLEGNSTLIQGLLGVLGTTTQRSIVDTAICGLLASCLAMTVSKTTPTQLTKTTQQLSSLDLEHMFWDCSTPSATENVLRLWGFSVDAKYRIQRGWAPQLVSESLELISICKAALNESNEFPLRFAAISCLNAFKIILEPASRIPVELEITLLLAIYKACVDDDEEIRETAGKTAVKVLESKHQYSKRVPQLLPSIASQMICQHLIKHFRHSNLLLEGALHSFFGIPFATLGAFHTCLRDALYRDTSLFATEKQNLYIDAVKEAQLWSGVLRRLDTSTMPAHLIRGFTNWTISGLELLTEKALNEVDGPLGWTSKPEVFTLGMQVIYATEVLLAWRTTTKKVPVRGSAIRRLLAQLEAAGTHSQLHEAWLREIQRVLEKSVLARLRRVHKVLLTARASTASL